MIELCEVRLAHEAFHNHPSLVDEESCRGDIDIAHALATTPVLSMATEDGNLRFWVKLTT